MQGYLEQEKALFFFAKNVAHIFTTFLQYKFHSVLFLNLPCPMNNFVSEKLLISPEIQKKFYL